MGGKKSGTILLGLDGTFGREGGRGVERNFLGWMELMGGKRGGTELLGKDGNFEREKGGTELLRMDGTFRREKGWNGTLKGTEKGRGKVL